MWSPGSAPASVSLDSRLRTPAGSGINGFTADMLQTVSLTQDEQSDQANVSFWSHWGNCSDLPWKSGKNSDNNLITTSHYKAPQCLPSVTGRDVDVMTVSAPGGPQPLSLPSPPCQMSSSTPDAAILLATTEGELNVGSHNTNNVGQHVTVLQCYNVARPHVPQYSSH